MKNLLKNLLNYHFGRIRIRSKKQDPDPHQVKSRVRIHIKLKSGSASNKNQNPDTHPDPHQGDKSNSHVYFWFFLFEGGESWRDIESAGGRECRVRGTPGREADPPTPGRAGAVQVLPHPGRVLRLLPLGSSQVPTGTSYGTVAGGKTGKTPGRNLPTRTVVNLRNR